jgi:LacI family transcriptional regulator
LEDIAKIAGVHRRTVRDALRGTGRVAVDTRKNVQRIADELRYEPNLIARALVTGKTGRISIVIGSLNEPYNVTVVQHLVGFVTQHGYEAMVIQAQDNRPSPQTLRSSFSDGIIVVGLQFFDSDVRTHGVMRGHSAPPLYPCVVIDARQPDYMDHITLDLGPAVEEALQLMIASGRRRIAYIDKHPMDAESNEVRFRTYLNLMGAAGYEPEIITASDEKLPPSERITRLKDYFRQHGAPGAILCHNDEIAIFTYRALRDLGYEIPTDSLLVGCDGVNYMNYFDPPLSTITIPWEEVGEKACQFLKQRIDEPDIPVQEHIVKGKLVVRASLGVNG